MQTFVQSYLVLKILPVLTFQFLSTTVLKLDLMYTRPTFLHALGITNSSQYSAFLFLVLPLRRICKYTGMLSFTLLPFSGTMVKSTMVLYHGIKVQDSRHPIASKVAEIGRVSVVLYVSNQFVDRKLQFTHFWTTVFWPHFLHLSYLFSS